RRRPPAPRSLTAASAPARVARGKVEAAVEMGADDTRLWEFYRTIGVVHYSMQFKRDAALRARILPAKIGKPGDDPEPTDETGPVEVFEELDAGRGRLAGAVGDLIVHLDVTGIGWPVYQLRDTENGPEDKLTVYGTREVKRMGEGRLQLTTAAGATRIDRWALDSEGEIPDMVATVWRPSPEAHALPDSPLRSVAEECEQLIALGRLLRAAAWSRTSAGILAVPEEMSLPPPVEAAPGERARIDPFLQDLTTALTAPISDPGSAAAVAPYVLYGPTDAVIATRFIDMGRRVTGEDLELLLGLKVAVVTGLDLPNEVATGLADANHWSAWLIDASAYRQHIDPPLILGLEGLSQQIYQPLLMRRLRWTREQADEFVLWRDISSLTTSPNRVADAILLFDRGIIGAEPVRRVAGYDETDKPGEESAQGPNPTPPAGAPGEPNPEKQEPPAPEGSGGPANATLAAASLPPGSWPAESLADLDGGLLARLTAASRDAQRRALDRAGARARNRLRKAQDLQAVVNGVPNREVTRRLGREAVVERLQLAESELVTEEDFDDLAADARRWLDRAVGQSALESERLGGEVDRDAEEENRAVDAAVTLLVATLLAATVARLFTPGREIDPAETGEVGDPDSLPAGQIMDVMTTAGGGAAGSIPEGRTFDVGVGNGPRAGRWLRNGGLMVVANVWVYGDRSARATNFIPHLTLDGIEFDRWDDPSLTTIGAWPRGGRYHPQDHRGCMCRHEKVLWRDADRAG
ncbi:MAG: hypothetical protein M3537_08165, partial [Chloroflexota bacterium]|nr:hypothetical protein [Chloroflexota bacterium]